MMCKARHRHSKVPSAGRSVAEPLASGALLEECCRSAGLRNFVGVRYYDGSVGDVAAGRVVTNVTVAIGAKPVEIF